MPFSGLNLIYIIFLSKTSTSKYANTDVMHGVKGTQVVPMDTFHPVTSVLAVPRQMMKAVFMKSFFTLVFIMAVTLLTFQVG